MLVAASVLDIFQCPMCSAELPLPQGVPEIRCPSCSKRYESVGGVIDLVARREPNQERLYYDQYYRDHSDLVAPGDITSLAQTWTGRDAPWEMRRVWKRLGNIAGKTVLLLGNGESCAELYMLTRHPRALVYSDLSPVGLMALSREFGGVDNLFFAAIDALDLPLRNASVDLVYGFAFVHHLSDLDQFLHEVARVLRPGGRAVFMDNGYSPLWQHMKLFWLRPIMWLSHRREPRSPEDIRDTMRGGLREDALAQAIEAVGGEPWFERVAFFYFYWKRVSVSVFPEIFRHIPRQNLISRALQWADLRLARLKFVRRNMIRLIWGMDKPRA
jgi:SAM-dependent methyltransferase